MLFVMEQHSTMMGVLIQMTGFFALRCGEACNLRAEDFKLGLCPAVLQIPKRQGSAKSPGNVPIMPEQASALRKLGMAGVTVIRVCRRNGRPCRVMDKYQMPTAGPLFLSRKKSPGTSSTTCDIPCCLVRGAQAGSGL